MSASNWVESNRSYYVKVWQKALSLLLKWPEQQIAQWIETHETGLNDQDKMFFHESPIWHVAHLLIPDAMRDELRTADRRRMLDQLQRAIEIPDAFSLDKEDYDWRAARERVDHILSQYERYRESRETND